MLRAFVVEKLFKYRFIMVWNGPRIIYCKAKINITVVNKLLGSVLNIATNPSKMQDTQYGTIRTVNVRFLNFLLNQFCLFADIAAMIPITAKIIPKYSADTSNSFNRLLRKVRVSAKIP